MIKNFFISSLPSSGKTTLLMEIIKELKLNAGGFYTSEIREKGIRKGFKIITLDGEEGILAHVNVKSPYQVSKYKVNIEDLGKLGVKSILDTLNQNKVIIIDEVGKAEMYSEKFKKAVSTALDSKNKVLGVIKLTTDPLTNKIRKRKDTKIFHLTRENREGIKKKVRSFLTQ